MSASCRLNAEGPACRAGRLSFVAESTLGKLAGWLRLAGFDTLLDKHIPDARILEELSAGQRIVLTRTMRVRSALPQELTIFIRFDRLADQVSQLVRDLALQRRDLAPLTRCAICNQPLHKAEKDQVIGCVPEYVWQSRDRFRRCSACGRCYWSGTHVERFVDSLDEWFKV